MANFDPAFAFLIGNEGDKLLDDPKTGEYSRFGITLATAAGFRLCAQDEKSFIDNLTEGMAKAFYWNYFWTPMNLTWLFDQAVANKILDMGVNMGSAQAARIAQRACNTLGAKIPVDGCIGTRTTMAANAIDGDHLLLELRAESLQFYRDLAVRDPYKYWRYWKDWKERAEK